MPPTASPLLQRIITDFFPRFVTGGRRLHPESRHLRASGQIAEFVRQRAAQSHPLMPSAVFVDAENTAIVLCDSIPHRGLIHDVRKNELAALFHGASASLVFISAIESRRELVVTFPAWETAVWVAEEPDHLIHFSGLPVLGPAQKPSV